MGRLPCCDKMGLKKGPWTPDEDTKLLAHIQLHGHGNWHALPSKAGLRRCGKSCRLRWANYLRPDIKRGKFSLEEDETIIQLHALLGNRWSAIAAHLPKRTDNEIKNYWNTHLKKRLTMMGIDPVTHKLKNQALIGCGQLRDTPDVSHMAQWESARLEAEARSKLDPLINPYQPLLHTAAEAPPPPRRPPCLDVLKAWAWSNPGKDVSTPNMLMNSFFSSSGVPSGLEYHDESITNPAGACTAGLPNSYQQQLDEAKGIMGNSMEIHDILNPNDPADSLGFQSFYMSHGFTNIATPSMASSNGPYYHINAFGSCWGVFEDNGLNYSCNKLNVINQGKSSGNIRLQCARSAHCINNVSVVYEIVVCINNI